MLALAIDDLIFKGTHNSYDCGHGAPPWMNHPPEQQIDDFGVWALELDYSAVRDRGGLVAVVGHNRPGHASCWGHYLADYLRRIHRARSLRYRPVFLFLEVKTWKRSWLRRWVRPADHAVAFQDKLDVGLEALHEACPDTLVILQDWLQEHDWRYPAPEEMAGKVVLYTPNATDPSGRALGLRGMHASGCVTPEAVEAAIESGRQLERNSTPCPGGARILRLDQYQADWTFEYGVPPNPIVVDPAAPAFSYVADAQGRPWRCGLERSHGQRVGEHGTYRFPFRTLAAAIERAEGITAATGGKPDERRAGRDWTLLIRGQSTLPELPREPGLRMELDLDGTQP